MKLEKTVLVLAAALFGLAGCGDSTPPAQDEAEVAWDYSPPPTRSMFEGLPWTLDGVKETYQEGFMLVYERSGTGKDGTAATGTHTFEVTEVEPQGVGIESVFDDGMTRGTGYNSYDWEKAVLLESNPSADDTEYNVTGKETVTVPAGTFDTTVVEVTNPFFKTRDVYWLIDDQPGVYAKWVDHGKQDNPTSIVMELVEIRSPAG